MVVFLSMSDASAGFDQIVDFLNGYAIQYALMVNDVVKLRALIDGNRVTVTEDVIRQVLCFDDANGMEYLPNEEIFTKLARKGYEEPPPKLTFYKAFLMNSVVQWRLLSSALQRVENLTFLSTFLTAWVGKSFSGVKTPLFATMLVQPQAKEEEDDVEISALEQDKIAQALETFKLKRRVKKLEKKRRSKYSGLKRGRIEPIDADEEITLVDMETQVDLGAELQGRKDDDNAAIKDVSDAEPTVFDDEEITTTMAQILIKMKAEKARLLDEQMAKRLHDEEIEQVAAREYNKVQTLFKHDKNVEEPQKKRVIDETLLQESFKKLKAVKVLGSHSTQDTPTDDPKEISKEDVKNMLEIIPVSKFKVEALQVKEDLDVLWRLVKETFSSAVPIVDKEKALWVKLKRLFEPDADDVIWKL
nr:hypothetical protein [Tanacetum cinerariifolium]